MPLAILSLGNFQKLPSRLHHQIYALDERKKLTDGQQHANNAKKGASIKRSNFMAIQFSKLMKRISYSRIRNFYQNSRFAVRRELENIFIKIALKNRKNRPTGTVLILPK